MSTEQFLLIQFCGGQVKLPFNAYSSTTTKWQRCYCKINGIDRKISIAPLIVKIVEIAKFADYRSSVNTIAHIIYYFAVILDILNFRLAFVEHSERLILRTTINVE